MSWNQNASASRPRRDQYGQLVKLLHVVVRDAWLGDTGPDESSSCADLVRVPRWLEQANWLTHFGNRHRAGNDDKTFRLKFQCVHSHQDTYLHRDNNGVDTHIKLLAGVVLVATWSQHDGDKEGLTDKDGAKAKVDWDALRRMPSGRLFVLRKGDVIVMPAGTYHYVYTIRTKVAIAGDFLSAIGWRRRVKSIERDGSWMSQGHPATAPL